MNSLIGKIAQLLPEWETRGTVYLYAFVERADINLWDVVISSAWSDEDMGAAVFTIAELLAAHLEPQEMTMLARIVPLPSSAPDIQEMPLKWQSATPKEEFTVYFDFLGLDVRRALIFKAQRPPAPSTEALMEANAVSA